MFMTSRSVCVAEMLLENDFLALRQQPVLHIHLCNSMFQRQITGGNIMVLCLSEKETMCMVSNRRIQSLLFNKTSSRPA